ncbi:MAG: hypothetical protein L6R42_009783, partial [Xanthoria sp. 1 TBL-2021]
SCTLPGRLISRKEIAGHQRNGVRHGTMRDVAQRTCLILVRTTSYIDGETQVTATR